MARRLLIVLVSSVVFCMTAAACKPDPLKAVQERAEQGDAAAQYNLGAAYFTGEGVSKSSVKAEPWLRKAAEQGNADAQYYLALVYLVDEGVPQNKGEAIPWLRKAAAQGNTKAQDVLNQFH